jgi:hypothetical protein
MATNNATNTSKPVNVSQGGTGVATLTTAYGVLCAGTTATGNVQTLASLGSSTQVLTSNGAGALPSFQAVAGGSSGLTFIASATASSSATIDFSNNLTSTYDNYLIVIEKLSPVTDGVGLQMLVGTGAGPTYQSTNYASPSTSTLNGSGSWVGFAAATTFLSICTSSSNNAMTAVSTDVACGTVLISNVNDSTNYKPMSSNLSYTAYNGGSHSPCLALGYGSWQGATVLTSLRFLFNLGNILTGTFKLYGFTN